MAQGRRRDAILTAARSEFARLGFAGARVERIAAAARVNKQLIFHYFQSKEGLYLAATSAIFASWQPATDSGAPPSDRLRQATARLVQWLSENPGAARAIVEAGRVPGGEPDAADPPSAAQTWLVGAKGSVRSAVEGGQRQGYFRDDVNPQSIAEIVTSAAIGHVMAAALDGGTSPANANSLVTDLSRAMVEYCAWR